MARTVESYISTSVEDLQTDLRNITDIELLKQIRAKCPQSGHDTRKRILTRRIEQLEKLQEKTNGENLAVAQFHAAVTRLGLVLDTLEDRAMQSGKKIKVHAETWKALQRHQQNLALIADKSLKEVIL